MWFHFDFEDRSNPYICISPDKLFKFLTYYKYQQTYPFGFKVFERKGPRPKTYTEKKTRLREIASRWQNDFPKFNYTCYELAEWQKFFETQGRKYGLLQEFRENGIL